MPIHRNGCKSNAIIKADTVPNRLGQDPDQTGATRLRCPLDEEKGQNYYGYKNHINIDKVTKLITAAACTVASIHDSQVLAAVLRDEVTGGKEVWADSCAYRSCEQEQSLKGSRHEGQIHERAYRNKPLTEAQALSNTEKSHVRARVEHVFGAMENDMGGIFLRSIGAARAKVGVSLMNLTYNLKRIETLIRLKVFGFDRIGAPVAQAIA